MTLPDLLTAAAAAYSVVATVMWWRAATSRRRVDADLEEMRYDPVTQLLTRRPWTQYAIQVLASGQDVVVVLCDLNGFKQVNDDHGHADGDCVLQEFAARLRAAFGPRALIGRFGGDEFVVLFPVPPSGINRDDLTAIANACVVPWRNTTVGASFGAARAADVLGIRPLARARFDHGSSQDTDHAARAQLARALHAADVACALAKQHYRSCPQPTVARWFDPATHDVPDPLPGWPLIRNRHS